MAVVKQQAVFMNRELNPRNGSEITQGEQQKAEVTVMCTTEPGNNLSEIPVIEANIANFNLDSVCAIGSNIQHHSTDHSDISSYYWCNFCNYRTNRREDLLAHINDHQFQCKKCDFQSFSRAEVVFHCVKEHPIFKKTAGSLNYCFLPIIRSNNSIPPKQQSSTRQDITPIVKGSRKRKAPNCTDKKVQVLVKKSKSSKKPLAHANDTHMNNDNVNVPMRTSATNQQYESDERQLYSGDTCIVSDLHEEICQKQLKEQFLKRNDIGLKHNSENLQPTNSGDQKHPIKCTWKHCKNKKPEKQQNKNANMNCRMAKMGQEKQPQPAKLTMGFVDTSMADITAGEAINFRTGMNCSDQNYNVDGLPDTNVSSGVTGLVSSGGMAESVKSSVMAGSEPYKCNHCNYSNPNTCLVKAHMFQKHPGNVVYVIDMTAVKLMQKRFVFICLGTNCPYHTKNTVEYLQHVETCDDLKAQISGPKASDYLKSLDQTKHFIKDVVCRLENGNSIKQEAKFGCRHCDYVGNESRLMKQHIIKTHPTLPTIFKNLKGKRGKKRVSFCKFCLQEFCHEK